jgi:hypothetical protein
MGSLGPKNIPIEENPKPKEGKQRFAMNPWYIEDVYIAPFWMPMPSAINWYCIAVEMGAHTLHASSNSSYTSTYRVPTRASCSHYNGSQPHLQSHPDLHLDYSLDPKHAMISQEDESSCRMWWGPVVMSQASKALCLRSRPIDRRKTDNMLV